MAFRTLYFIPCVAGSLSPVSNNGAVNEEVSKITEEMASLTSNLQMEEEPIKFEKEKPAEQKEPTQEDINEAVAQIDMCFGDDEGYDDFVNLCTFITLYRNTVI